MTLSNFSNPSFKRTAKPVQVGDHVPDFALPTPAGTMFSIQEVLGKKNLVIFFYPADDTPGCTKEVCSFRDHYEQFLTADTDVIGISGQDEGSKEKFTKKHQLPFILLADKGNQVRKRFGVPKAFLLIPGRVTYVVDKQGVVRDVFKSLFGHEEHVKNALNVIQGLP